MWRRTLFVLLVISLGAMFPLVAIAHQHGSGGNQGSGPGEKRPACCVVEDVSSKFGCSPTPGGSSSSLLCGVFAAAERLICGSSGSCTVGSPPPPPPPPPPGPY